MMKKIYHIDIPFDELQLFRDSQKYLIFLAESTFKLTEALLLSTKIKLHVRGNNFDAFFVLTKHHLWFIDKKNINNIFALPATSLVALIKSLQYPQFIFLTAHPYDNLRISCSNQQRQILSSLRCMNIVSGLSFLSTKMAKNNSTLKVVIVEKMAEFQRLNLSQKNQTSLDELLTKYPSEDIVYKQPIKGHIYGSLEFDKKRLQLIKVVYNSRKHMIHVARILPEAHLSNHSQKFQNYLWDYYYLHTIEKTAQIISLLREYKPLPYHDLSEELVCVRQLDYKVQVFFRYLPQICKQDWSEYEDYLSPQRLLIELIRFYKILLKYPESILDFQLLCYQKIQTKQKEIGKERSEQQTELRNRLVLKLREFRYQFLLTSDRQIKKLIYQCYYQKGELIYCNGNQSWKGKFYHLGLLVYEFIYGKPYFDYQLEPQLILKIKRQKHLIFPKFLNTSSSLLMSFQLQDFLEKAIMLKFKSLQAVYQHPWMKNVIALGNDRFPGIIGSLEDKND